MRDRLDQGQPVFGRSDLPPEQGGKAADCGPLFSQMCPQPGQRAVVIVDHLGQPQRQAGVGQFVAGQHKVVVTGHRLERLAGVDPVPQRIGGGFRGIDPDIGRDRRQQLIPAQITDAALAPDLKGAAYEYEPSEEAILETLLPRNITVQILSALLENMAGFYASQMTAMDNATRNAGDMIRGLTIQYNRTRQAQITKELIEIISGAEAL